MYHFERYIKRCSAISINKWERLDRRVIDNVELVGVEGVELWQLRISIIECDER